MAAYLPLCAFREGLLPSACRKCLWWQTTGSERLDEQGLDKQALMERKRYWMLSLEKTWGTTGLLLENTSRKSGERPAQPSIVASISFCPPEALPRLHELSFNSLPRNSAVIFCLRTEPGVGYHVPKRLLHKSLAQLKDRGVYEAFAVARDEMEALTSGEDSRNCRFFPPDFLVSNGFHVVSTNRDLILMRADLRGLLSLFERVESAVRRLLRNEPTPSPAAWSRHST